MALGHIWQAWLKGSIFLENWKSKRELDQLASKLTKQYVYHNQITLGGIERTNNHRRCPEDTSAENKTNSLSKIIDSKSYQVLMTPTLTSPAAPPDNTTAIAHYTITWPYIFARRCCFCRASLSERNVDPWRRRRSQKRIKTITWSWANLSLTCFLVGMAAPATVLRKQKQLWQANLIKKRSA